MFAEIAQRRCAVAIELADDLARRRPSTHELHFNLGQVYWMAGDPERGRQHLTLAATLARDDQERLDVVERVAQLSGTGDHG
jgi:lipopolysaccharide biosynthesis regulator YciM